MKNEINKYITFKEYTHYNYEEKKQFLTSHDIVLGNFIGVYNKNNHVIKISEYKNPFTKEPVSINKELNLESDVSEIKICGYLTVNHFPKSPEGMFDVINIKKYTPNKTVNNKNKSFFTEGKIVYLVKDKLLIECKITNFDKDNKIIQLESVNSIRKFDITIFELGHKLFFYKADAEELYDYEEFQKFYYINTKDVVSVCTLLRYDPKSNILVLQDFKSKIMFQGNVSNLGKSIFKTITEAIEYNLSKEKAQTKPKNVLKENPEHITKDFKRKTTKDIKRETIKETKHENIKKDIKRETSVVSKKEFKTQIFFKENKAYISGEFYNLGQHIFIPKAYNRVEHARIFLEYHDVIKYICLDTLHIGSFKKSEANKKYFYNVDKATTYSMKFPNPNKSRNLSVPTGSVFAFTRSSRYGNGSRRMAGPRELPKALQGKSNQNYKEDT